MIDLQTYVTILLIVAAIGMYFIVRVIIKQLNLFRIVEAPNIQRFRIRLFLLSVGIVLFGLIPIGINIYSLATDNPDRPHHISVLSLIYSAGVHMQSLFLSYILWRIYRLSDDQEAAVTELERKHLSNEPKKEKTL